MMKVTKERITGTKLVLIFILGFLRNFKTFWVFLRDVEIFVCVTFVFMTYIYRRESEAWLCQVESKGKLRIINRKKG